MFIISKEFLHFFAKLQQAPSLGRAFSDSGQTSSCRGAIHRVVRAQAR
jgi:hypothetical protein